MFKAKVCGLLCGEIQLLLKEELTSPSLRWFIPDREGKACWDLGAWEQQLLDKSKCYCYRVSRKLFLPENFGNTKNLDDMDECLAWLFSAGEQLFLAAVYFGKNGVSDLETEIHSLCLDIETDCEKNHCKGTTFSANTFPLLLGCSSSDFIEHDCLLQLLPCVYIFICFFWLIQVSWSFSKTTYLQEQKQLLQLKQQE